MMKAASPDSYQKPMKSSVRPPLIPTEGEEERQEESFFGSLGKLLSQTGASAAEILGGIFPWFQKKSWSPSQYQQQEPLIQQQNKYSSNTWPVQDSYVIRDEDDPPSIEARTPTPRKTYPFMSKDSEKMQQFRQGRAFYSGWDGNFQQQQPSQQQMQTQKQQHRHQYHSSSPQTYYEQTSERTNEIVFGAVQQDGEREAVVIKPLDHGNNIPYDRHRTIRSRMNSIGSYSNGHH